MKLSSTCNNKKLLSSLNFSGAPLEYIDNAWEEVDDDICIEDESFSVIVGKIVLIRVSKIRGSVYSGGAAITGAKVVDITLFCLRVAKMDLISWMTDVGGIEAVSGDAELLEGCDVADIMRPAFSSHSIL